MPSLSPKDRVSLCLFTFPDGRRCRTPRIGRHPISASTTPKRRSQSQSAEKLGKDLAYFFSGDYLSAYDLSTALSRLIPAVIRGEIKPKLARTIAYMVQTLLQPPASPKTSTSTPSAPTAWREAVSTSVNTNHDYLFPPDPNDPDPEHEPGDKSDHESQDDHPAPPQAPPQPAPSTPVGAGLARPDSPTTTAATQPRHPHNRRRATPNASRPSPADPRSRPKRRPFHLSDRADTTQTQPKLPTANPTPTQTAQPNNAPPPTPPPPQPDANQAPQTANPTPSTSTRTTACTSTENPGNLVRKCRAGLQPGSLWHRFSLCTPNLHLT